ncbi:MULTISPECIES: IS3 family transposase [Bacillus]|uniref:IS3 family transposase n=1 Tax=Bacillus TaxID=1386 RepID=UPI00267F161A
MIEFDVTGEVLWVNDIFAKALRYSKEEMVGLKHRQFCPPHIAEHASYQMFWKRLKEGQIFQENVQRITKHGANIDRTRTTIVERTVKEYIHYYNNIRIQTKLNQSPINYRQLAV